MGCDFLNIDICLPVIKHRISGCKVKEKYIYMDLSMHACMHALSTSIFFTTCRIDLLVNGDSLHL